MNEMTALIEQWKNLKETEKDIIDARRDVEDRLLAYVKVKPEGTETTDIAGAIIKVTTRLNRKIDADLLQEIAAENGTTDQLGTLFRWKPDLNMQAWKAADQSITTPLLDAITTTQGRPSFNITIKE